MSTAGTYTPPTWANGVSVLNQATMTQITDAIKALDARVQNKDNNYSFFKWRDYYYLRNTRGVEAFQSGFTASGVGATVSDDTTNTWLVDKSIRVNETNNTAGALWCVKSISIHMGSFHDGSSSDTIDKVIFSFYVSNASKTGSVNVQLGNDGSNMFTKSWLTADLVSGWNTKVVTKSDFGTYGSPNWASNITYLACGWDSLANASGEYVSFQYIGMYRADPTDSSKYDPFQEENGTAWQAGKVCMETGNYYVLFSEGGSVPSPGIFKANPNIYGVNQLKIASNWNNFYAMFLGRCKKANYTPSFTLYYDANNWITTYVTSSSQHTKKRIAGTTTDSLGSTSPAIAKGDMFYFFVEKVGDIVRVCFKNSTSSAFSHHEINVSGFPSYTDMCNIYIGTDGTSSYGNIYDFIVSNDPNCVVGSSGINLL